MAAFTTVGGSGRVTPPRVRIVIPVYNGERFIADAIRSVLGQTVADWELVIVDDGSTDSTVEVVKQFRDARVRLVQTVHRGPETARLGMALQDCGSDYVAQFDSDDIMVPDRLERQLVFLEGNPVVVAVGGQIEYVSEDGKKAGFRSTWPLDHESIVNLECHLKNGICNPTITARTAAYLGLKLLVDGGPGEDVGLALQLAMKGKLANLPSVVNLMRIHSKSIQSTADVDQRVKRSEYGVLCYTNHMAGRSTPQWHEFEAEWYPRPVWVALGQYRESLLAHLVRRGIWERLNRSAFLRPSLAFFAAAVLAPIRSVRRLRGLLRSR